MDEYPREFEQMSRSGNLITERLNVPNGWIIRTRYIGLSSSMVFIPEDYTKYWKLEEE